jgi:hypothetical protein
MQLVKPDSVKILLIMLECSKILQYFFVCDFLLMLWPWLVIVAVFWMESDPLATHVSCLVSGSRQSAI